jgi:hypothetical protein
MSRQFQDAKDDLTGQQKAVESYLELLASARASGPVDQMRWGAVLTRVSRMTGIPVDALHARFAKRKPAPAARPAVAADASEPVSPPPTPEETVKIPRDRELAERQMLGILLKEPQRWHRVGQVVHPEDFGMPVHRRLAETYWQHQQDLGEPEFSEFLGELPDDRVKELAVELVELAEALPEVEVTLNGTLNFLEEEKRRREEQKQLAELRRISQQNAAAPDVEAKWAEFVKNNQTADPKRLGPVRRFKSGS